jgi:hypothetical protein
MGRRCLRIEHSSSPGNRCSRRDRLRKKRPDRLDRKGRFLLRVSGGHADTRLSSHDANQVIVLLPLPQDEEFTIDRIVHRDYRFDVYDPDVVDGKTPALDGPPRFPS